MRSKLYSGIRLGYKISQFLIACIECTSLISHVQALVSDKKKPRASINRHKSASGAFQDKRMLIKALCRSLNLILIVWISDNSYNALSSIGRRSPCSYEPIFTCSIYRPIYCRSCVIISRPTYAANASL
jgi:hypothetical protein